MTVVVDSFEDSFGRLASIARSRADRILESSHEAEEVAQEALLRAHASWSDISTFAEQWVSRVSTNLAIGQLRRRRPLEHAEMVVDDTTSAAVRLDVRRALEALPRRQREAVVLRHVLDLSERDVAEAMGCSAGTVKRHLHRALEALRGAPSLAAFQSDVIETYGENLMYTWQDHFSAAVEPEAGWPPRPWDHRLFGSAGGNADRIAVDSSGRPIVDADGDEVMTGAGVDHVPVKRLRLDEPDPDVGDLPASGLDDDLLAAVERASAWAAWHGHTWVGVEHVLLALLERHPETVQGIEGLATDLHQFNRAVATFHEGPFADVRLDVVADRRAADWRPTRGADELEPTPTGALVANLDATAAAAVAEGRLASPADFVRRDLGRQPGPSLLRTLASSAR